MSSVRTLSAALALVLIPVATTHADSRLDASFGLGGHFFAEDGALGAGDRMDDPGPLSSALLTGRVGLQATRRLAIEGEVSVIPTEDDVLGDQATVFGLRTHARVDLATGKLRPFLVGGIGMLVVRGGQPQLSNDTQPALHWGAGVRYGLTRSLDLRVDARHLIVPDRTPEGLTNDLEVTAGIGYRFGVAPARKPLPRPIAAVEPPRDRDRDRDGILDGVDRCPDKAEDQDGFEDGDGCPDLDNDKDGIADAMDTCPLEPETVNAYKDGDGCADELITELAGIGFEMHSARIDAASQPVLDRAYEILVENPKLRIEVSGHTSSEGDVAMNQELSRWRAEAVRRYLIKRGIDGGRLVAIGKGSSAPVADNKRATERAKNRRIELRVLLPETLHEGH